MQGDGAIRVDDLLELVDDTVAVGGGFAIGKPGHPFGFGLLVASADLIDDFLLDATAGRADALAHSVDDGAEGQLGVGEHGEIDLVGLVEISGVGVDVDDADTLRDGPAVGAVGLTERVPDSQDDVGLTVDLDGGAGGVAAAGIDAAAQR